MYVANWTYHCVITVIDHHYHLWLKHLVLQDTKIFLGPLLSNNLLAVTNLQNRTLCMTFMKIFWRNQRVENWQNRSLCELVWHWECLPDATAHFDAFFVKRTQLGQSLSKIAYLFVCVFVCLFGTTSNKDATDPYLYFRLRGCSQTSFWSFLTTGSNTLCVGG